MAYTALVQKASSVILALITMDLVWAWLSVVVTAPAFFPLPLSTGEAPERASVFPDMCLHQCLRSQRLYTGDTANSKQA